MITTVIGVVVSIIALIASIAGVVVSIAGVIVSYIVARKYGDTAALEASRKLHEEDARKARSMALQSLLNEVERIRKLVEYDAGSGLRIRLPTAAFETAFASGAPGLAADSKLLNIAAEYLALADRVNTCVETYVAGVPSGEAAAHRRMRIAFDEIRELCTSMLPGNLDQLSVALQRELDCTAPEG